MAQDVLRYVQEKGFVLTILRSDKVITEYYVAIYCCNIKRAKTNDILNVFKSVIFNRKG